MNVRYLYFQDIFRTWPVRFLIPEFVVQKVAQAAKMLNINYAGFDAAVTPAGIYLLAFNPQFGISDIPCTSADSGRFIHEYLVKR